MKHLKYSNKIVMAIITVGYLALILIDLFLHIDIMYFLAPYVLLTFCIIYYTRKRSTAFDKYYLGFEIDLNEKGHLLTFFILASNFKANPSRNIEIIKSARYQTNNILDLEQFRQRLISLGYIVIIPNFVSQINHLLVNHNDVADSAIGISAFYYDDILPPYHKFKATVINILQQDEHGLLIQDQAKSQHRTSDCKNKILNLFCSKK